MGRRRHVEAERQQAVRVEECVEPRVARRVVERHVERRNPADADAAEQVGVLVRDPERERLMDRLLRRASPGPGAAPDPSATGRR